MERQIKFRGKLINSNEWLYGGYYQASTGEDRIITVDETTGTITDWNVQPDTLGQFTGLLDKNGKEIYEGDILKGRTNKWRMESKPAPHDFIGYVRWEGQCDVGLQWVLTTLDSVGSAPLNWYVHCCAIDYSTGEIIGSIHDNPELIRDKR